MKTANPALLRHLTAQMRAAIYRVRHHRPPTRFPLRPARYCLFALLFILMNAAVYATSSASSPDKSASGNLNAHVVLKDGTTVENYFLAAMRRAFPPVTASVFFNIPAPLQPQIGPPPIPTLTFYAANCTTPQNVFNLTDTVCVKVTNVDPNLKAHVDWVGATDLVQASSPDITTGSLTASFTIPANGNVGLWRANITSISDGAARASSFFTVRDPNNANADLSVNKLVKRATASPGSDIEFELDVINNGPNDATTVVLTDTVPNDTTFVSLTQETGNNFTCTTPAIGAIGASTCTINTLASGEQAIFTVVYKVSPGAPADEKITATASIQATSPGDRFAPNDTSTDSAPVHIEPCVVTCPANITNVPNAHDEFGAFVTLPLATGSSAACGDLNYSPASGSLFPVGVTVVSVSGETGNACSFTVEVKDTQSPTIDCPDDYTTFESAAGAGSAIVNYAPPLATDNDPSFNNSAVSCLPASGSSFNVGTTPVTCTATDAAGNSNTCSFNVTVQSQATCTLSCPANISQDSDANSCGANVNYAAEASTDCGAVTYTNAKTGAALPSGSFFPVGTTTVKAASATGETCFFRVTIRDTTPPSFTCPASIVVNAGATACEARVTITTPAVTDNCTSATIKGVRDDGHALTDAYPVGTTTITWTATDKAGLTASCEQTVKVKDSLPPDVKLVPDVTVSVPADACLVEVPEVIQVSSGGPEGTAPPLGTASDNCKPLKLLTIVQTPAAGTLVGPGAHTITVTVYDGDPEDTTNPPNSTTKTMVFRVNDVTPPTITAPPSVNASTDAGSCAATGVALGTPTVADNCSGTTVTNNAPSSFPKGTTTVIWTVRDGGGNTATASQSVTVSDHQAPTLTLAGANPMTVECHTGFTDPGASATDNCDAVTVSVSGSVNPNVVGTYTLTYTASDTSGNTGTATRTINVVDTSGPTITLNGQNITLWPPNHKYQTINISDLVASASDTCDSSVNLSKVFISKVTSDEAENSGGDGNTLNDIVIAANCKSVQLRAERDGGSNGRVYTITFKVRDAAGNVATKTAQVKVPANQGNGGSAVDSGPQYTVMSSCQ
ncbi:MAG TPA: HYR domain-containing protein [Pyrinomonadaceae bacterium]|nr:HYR domain-containing protein [Pyrinomonadaceae bacterium]